MPMIGASGATGQSEPKASVTPASCAHAPEQKAPGATTRENGKGNFIRGPAQAGRCTSPLSREAVHMIESGDSFAT